MEWYAWRPLQEQFLKKAGLVDKKKVKQVNQEKSTQKKSERRTGVQAVDEVCLAALETQRKNAERARELNAQRDAAAQQKAIMAQIVQMVQQNRQPRGKGGNGDIAYNYTFGNKIEKIHVSAEVQAHLVAGRLAIVCLGERVELVAGDRRQDRRTRRLARGGAGQESRRGRRCGRSVCWRIRCRMI